MDIFDRKLLQFRANKLPKNKLISNFLKEEICNRTAEKLGELKTNFSLGLELGSGIGEFYNSLYNSNSPFFNPNKINKLWQSDFSINFLKSNHYPNKIVINEEHIPFKNEIFDIVVSNFSLHNINNPFEVFKNIYRILNYNGAILLSIPITGTLNTLAEALFETEIKLFKGVSPRIHPFVDIETLGNLIQSVGFKEITVDRDKIEIMYKNIPKLFEDLKSSAQNNILVNRNKKFVGKNFFKEVESYLEKYKDAQSNCYPVVVQFANLIAWK